MEMYTLLICLVGIIAGYFVLYYVIKTAVINGIRDSGLIEQRHEQYVENKIQENTPNSAQLLLKQKYEKGEMTFDVYKSEWNKLKT